MREDEQVTENPTLGLNTHNMKIGQTTLNHYPSHWIRLSILPRAYRSSHDHADGSPERTVWCYQIIRIQMLGQDFTRGGQKCESHLSIMESLFTGV